MEEPPYFIFGDVGQGGEPPPPKPRDRSRTGVGKSAKSHIKHRIISSVVRGQAYAFQRIKPNERIVLIDGNAGDGEGVEREQIDFFDANLSTTTSGVLAEIAQKMGAYLILCEKSKERRASLAAKFRDAIILSDNMHAPAAIPSDCGWALWVSDPCGPSGHGVSAMKTVSKMIRSDFVIAMNEGWIATRCAGLTGECEDERARRASATMRERYLPMIETPTWWADELNRSHLSRTPIVSVSNAFQCRIFVAANYLAHPATRSPFEVIK